MALFTNRHIPKTALVYGEQLKPGEVIRETDVYDAVDGTWREAGKLFKGTSIREGDHVMWVRPDHK